MATKTIRIELDVYERLLSLRSTRTESFSQVIGRTLPAATYWTGEDILRAIEKGEWTGIGASTDGLAMIEEAGRLDAQRVDPWNKGPQQTLTPQAHQ